jgi:hypothetical protein
MDYLVGQNLPGCDVVAVAKAARKDKNMIAVEDARIFDDPVDMDPIGLGPSQLKSVLGLKVAVYSGCPQYYSFYLFHGTCAFLT